MEKFFYTFHESWEEPHKGGWVEVHANNWDEADKKFRSIYPDFSTGAIGCYYSYSDEMFLKAKKYHRINGCCHKVIE